MKRFEKVFYIIEVIIVVVFSLISYLTFINGFEINKLFVLLLSFVLLILASTLNICLLVAQRRNDEKNNDTKK